MKRLIVALDTPDLTEAVRWADAVSDHAGALKLGLEFFLTHGRAGYQAIKGAPIFLDLKLHDIPNTVAGAVRAVLGLRPKMLTIHASGGPAMIAAAKAAASSTSNPPLILAVTLLTSLDEASVKSIGMDRSPTEQVRLLAAMAVQAGADGLVCSPHEVAPLRQLLDPSVKLIVPGIRPSGSPVGDQARVMTPKEAVTAGADWIVVGRPITASGNPADSAAQIAFEIA